jgi:RNA polymerase sigma-70 factor (ECF subfamily)
MGHVSTDLDQLILLATRGDRAAQETLLLHFHDPLLLHINQFLAPSPATGFTMDDVLQETLVEAFRGFSKLKPLGSDAFLGWLRTIARTRMINMVNRARAEKRGGQRRPLPPNAVSDQTICSVLSLIAGAGPTPSLALRRKEAAAALAVALEKLDPLKREVMELRFGKGLSVPEVAEQLGKNESAVKMLIHRTVKELRASMDNLGEFTAGV